MTCNSCYVHVFVYMSDYGWDPRNDQYYMVILVGNQLKAQFLL